MTSTGLLHLQASSPIDKLMNLSYPTDRILESGVEYNTMLLSNNETKLFNCLAVSISCKNSISNLVQHAIFLNQLFIRNVKEFKLTGI